MGTWLSEVWWWLIPMAFAPFLALRLFRWVKVSVQGPTPIRTIADTTAKWVLGAFALLAGSAALSSHQVVAIALAILMFAILHVPALSNSWVIPNWGRYVAYIVLFIVFSLIFEVGRGEG